VPGAVPVALAVALLLPVHGLRALDWRSIQLSTVSSHHTRVFLPINHPGGKPRSRIQLFNVGLVLTTPLATKSGYRNNRLAIAKHSYALAELRGVVSTHVEALARGK